MRKNTIAVLLIFVMSLFAGSSASHAANLRGIWVNSTVGMRAHVYKRYIQVHFVGSDYRALYWSGTFDSTVANNTVQTSMAFEDDMENAIFASSRHRKGFRYRDGVLSFKVRLPGFVRKIYLYKKS